MIKVEKAKPYFMIAPSMILFAIFSIYPILYMIYLSFHEWNLVSPVKKFVGIQNFTSIIKDDVFLKVVKNSIVYMGITVSFTMILGILTALFLFKNSKINRILQSMAFAPYIVSMVSVAFLWKWIMDSDYGLLNYVLSFINIDKINWLQDEKTALLSLCIIAIWKSVGYNAIVILSALKAVPGYIYEAARLDNGKPVNVFFKITLPMISPTLFFLTIINIINSFKVFEPIALITEGGPLNSTNTLVYYIYEYGFKLNNIGYASAAGVVLFIIIGIMTIFYFKILSKKVHYK